MSRRSRASLAVAPGERLLASATTEDGQVVGGTRLALYWSRVGEAPARVAWDEVEAADWDRETSRLRISETGTWGVLRPEHAWTVSEPGRLLELVRERVSATVVIQQHVPVRGRRGLRVIARRDPRGTGPLRWLFEYDDGVDPDDPEVQRVADAALAQARDQVELG